MVFPEPIASSVCRACFSAETSAEDFNFVAGGTVSPPTPESLATGGSAALAAASVAPSVDIAGKRGPRRRRGVMRVVLRPQFLAREELITYL